MFSFFGGGGVNKPIELAYAEITAEFDIADATNETVIAGLTFTFIPESNIRYCYEFYSPSVEENSGTTLGDIMLVRLYSANIAVAFGFAVNGLGGIGTHIHIKSSTYVGDGLPHIVTATVQNRTTGTNGAIIYALLNSPTYIRAVRL